MKRALLFFTMLMVCVSLVYAQQRQITGKVTGSDGAPVPFATIQIKGTNTGATADQNGNFKLNVTGNAILVVRSVGFQTQEVPASASGEMNIRLTSDSKNLQEVVVTALGLTREKKSVGYATTTVTSADINKISPVSMMDGLQGKVAGVDISSMGGNPGASGKVIIRGYSSLQGNNQPLYVIDGVPLNNSRLGGSTNSDALNANEAFDFGNNANDINPNDIENISILKGAAATSLYGSRAASGAIIITTKKGRQGKPRLEVNSAVTFTKVGMLPEFQNDFGQGWDSYQWLPENGSWGPRLDGKIRPWGAPVNGKQLEKPFSAHKNSMRDFYSTGKEFNNNIAFSGGTETQSFYLSYGNITSDGILPTNADSYVRNTISLRGSQTWGNFRASASLNYASKQAKYMSTDAPSGIGASMFEDILQIPRDIYIPDFRDYKNPYYNVDNYFTPYAENPYYILNENGSNFKSDRVFGNLDLTYKITDWMGVQWRIGADITNGRYKIWHAKNAPTPGSYNDGGNEEGSSRQPDVGDVGEGAEYSGEYNSDFMLNFNKRINSDFTFDGILGFNYNDRVNRRNYTKIEDLVVPGFYDLTNSANPPTTTYAYVDRRLMGLYAQANFGFRDYLFLSVNARNDWSSTLPVSKNSFFYPGANLSFLLSEALKTDPRGLTFAKLRASYGKTGNDAAPYYTLTQMKVGEAFLGATDGDVRNTFPFNGVGGFTIENVLKSSTLKPEISTEYEFGAELRFLNSRIGLDVAYYNKTSDGQILRVPITPSTGFNYKIQNFGKIRNKGIEVALMLTPVKTRDFTWDLNYTFSRNRNEVLELPSGLDRIVLASAYDAKFVAIKGKPLGVFEAPVPRLDPQGRMIVAANGLPIPDVADGYYGTSQRDFMMGLMNTFSYKGLSLRVSLDYRKGGVFYSGTSDLTYFVGNAMQTTYNDRKPFVIPNTVIEVVENGKTTYVPNNIPIDMANYDDYWYHTTNKAMVYNYRILDKTFLKMRDISLSYSLPQSISQRIGAQNLSVTLYGRNLFIWTPEGNTTIDPEVSNYGNDLRSEFGEFRTGPGTKSYGASLKFTF